MVEEQRKEMMNYIKEIQKYMMPSEIRKIVIEHTEILENQNKTQKFILDTLKEMDEAYVRLSKRVFCLEVVVFILIIVLLLL